MKTIAFMRRLSADYVSWQLSSAEVREHLLLIIHYPLSIGVG